MIERDITPELKSLALQYPVVTVLGPRQSGKTTLVKKNFPEKPYVNLEEPDTRMFADLDPRAFIEQYPQGAILDEIQRIPKLLSYIQTIVDKDNPKGMFILTGSHQLELHHAISQSLAGRTALLKLYPLSIRELTNANITLSIDEYLYQGFYPRIYNDNLNATKAYRNYFQTYVERDVRQIVNVKDLAKFQQFIKLCAGRIGQLINMQSLSNDLGIANHTVQHWLSILEASFLIIKLEPYFENFGKRLIKAPKLYFADVGLATYLLDIENMQQLSRDPLRGNLFENLVIMELIKARLNQGLDPHLYFYRDNHQNEVDVIFKQGNQLIPIEIKAAKTFHPEFLKGIRYLHKLIPERCKGGYLVYGGEQQQHIQEVQVINYKYIADQL